MFAQIANDMLPFILNLLDTISVFLPLSYVVISEINAIRDMVHKFKKENRRRMSSFFFFFWEREDEWVRYFKSFYLINGHTYGHFPVLGEKNISI